MIAGILVAANATSVQAQPQPTYKAVAPQMPAFKPLPPPPILRFAPPAANKIESFRPGDPTRAFFRDGEAPPPVAMYPPKDEPVHQTSGSVATDPQYEAAIAAAFAAREKRAHQADQWEAQAKVYRAKADLFRRRLAPDASHTAIANQDTLADRADAQAKAMRPQTAPPLSDAEKAANTQRLAQMAPSGRDGYCRELTNPSRGAVAASVVCSCGEQYLNSLIRQINLYRDEGEKYFSSAEANGIMAAVRARGPAVGGPVELQNGLRQQVRFAQDAANISGLCAKAAFRDSDMRRRLIPVSAMRGYEPGGFEDQGVKAAVYRQIASTARFLAEMPGLVGGIRVVLAREISKAQIQDDDYKKRFDSTAQAYRQRFLKNLVDYKHGRQDPAADTAAIDAGRRIGQAAETALAPLCNAHLKQVLAVMSDTDHTVVDIASEYRKNRSILLARFQTDLNAWEMLAKRNGAPGPVLADAPGGDEGIGGRDHISVGLAMSLGGSVVPFGESYPSSAFVGVSSDPEYAFHHFACLPQFAQLVGAARAIYSAHGSYIDFNSSANPAFLHSTGAFTLPTLTPWQGAGERETYYGFGFELWQYLKAPPEPDVKKVADSEDAQGGRYPEDGP